MKLLVIALLVSGSVSAAIGQLPSNHSGRLDRSYGSNGLAAGPGVLSPTGGSDSVMSPDSEVFYSYADNTSLNRKILVVKQRSDGSPDDNFGNNGRAEIALDHLQIWSVGVVNIALQADRKVLVSGMVSKITGVDGFVVRLNSTGSADTDFGTGGIVLFDFTPPGSTIRSDDVSAKISVDTKGRILVLNVAGHIQQAEIGDYVVALTRLDSAGSPDQSFGANGTRQLRAGEYRNGQFDETNSGLRIQADGRILLGVTTREGNKYLPLILRFLDNGEIDSTFSEDGIVNLFPTHFGTTSKLKQIAVQNDGKILALLTDRLTLLHLNGSTDSGFGLQGSVRSGLFDFDGATPNSMAITTDDKIVVSAWGMRVETHQYFSVLRKYWSDGSQDLRFGTNGKASYLHPDLIVHKLLMNAGDRHLRVLCSYSGMACSGRIFSGWR